MYFLVFVSYALILYFMSISYILCIHYHAYNNMRMTTIREGLMCVLLMKERKFWNSSLLTQLMYKALIMTIQMTWSICCELCVVLKLYAKTGSEKYIEQFE